MKWCVCVEEVCEFGWEQRVGGGGEEGGGGGGEEEGEGEKGAEVAAVLRAFWRDAPPPKSQFEMIRPCREVAPLPATVV